MDARLDLILNDTRLESRADLARLVPEGGLFIELGVAAGHYAAQVLAANPTMHYLGVDAWADHHDEAERLRAVAKLAPYERRASTWQMRFDEALPMVAGLQADVVYVDGYAHTGQEGGQTLEDWWHVVRVGGWLCGHDYSRRWPKTIEAVDRFARDKRLPVRIVRDADTFWSWAIHKPDCETRLGILHGARVVVVGNGPSVLSEERGTDIDSFDVVVRINRYQTEGFERFTGERTDVWATVGHGELPQDVDRSRWARDVVLIQERQRPGYLGARLGRVEATFFNQLNTEVRTLSERPEAERAGIIASSGCVLVAWLLEVVGCKQVWGVGFDHFSRDRAVTRGRHHYWIDKPFGEVKQHDGEAERRLFERWKAEGKWRPIEEGL